MRFPTRIVKNIDYTRWYPRENSVSTKIEEAKELMKKIHATKPKYKSTTIIENENCYKNKR